MVNFFIDRPIFAWVLAIGMMLIGIASITALPVDRFPSIAPPAIQIQSVYSGASADTVENTVTQVIEQQMRGLDHLLYMSSTSDDFGTATIRLTFAAGTDPDIAQVQVQNKLQLATPQLPMTVQQSGIRVTKSNNNQLMAVAFVSEDGSMNRDELTNYVAANVRDPVSRVTGVGEVQLWGAQFAMRIWLDAAKLNNYKLNATDVTQAVEDQNVQIAGGSLGGTLPVPGQMLQATITEATLLRSADQFGNILLKVNPDGSQVRIKDVARVELAGEDYNYLTEYSGRPSAGMAIQLGAGANALEVAEAVRATVAELEPFLPAGMVVRYPNDTTPFITASISDVVKTLFEGMVLVFLVMYLFLQNFRATLIPTIAVPVVLLGTFAVMLAAGFSINTLSMFGLVLAIGLLVDDAIVVVESVERVMAEEGLSPRKATRKAMSQISGALVGVALVISAVFVPVAFSGGSVGAIYRQFSLTIVVAMVLSVLVALILTPALCATILKPATGHAKKNGFFGWFNRTFDAGQVRYHKGVQHIIRRSARWLVLYGLLIAVVGLLFVRLPTSFLPEEDQGRLFVLLRLPAGATQARTAKVLKDVSAYLHGDEKQIVQSTWEINGYSFSGRGQNSGVIFVQLKPYADRQDADQKAQALIERINKRFSAYKDAEITAGSPPAIPELGTASGFDLQLIDRAGLGHEALIKAKDQLLSKANANPALEQVRANGLSDTPKFKVNVDREKASALGLTAAGIDQAFAIAWGSAYVNNFLDLDNRIKRVFVQADAKWRMNPENMNDWFLRNSAGDMVPFSAFGSGQWTYGSPKLERYNGIASLQIQGNAATGTSTGEAMDTMEALIGELPDGIGYEWTGMSYQERESGSQAIFLYAVSILVVFLCLAALYESWAIPISVILVVPLGIVGALTAATLAGLENDVFFQVALLTTVGLSAKNAILIVEFARELETQGTEMVAAAIEAARMRLRPILMTSMAFILGVLPLVFSNGAGSASQHAIGTAVIGGMLTATFLAIFMTPMFFVLVRKTTDALRAKFGHSEDEQDEHVNHATAVKGGQ
ncbi:efflux RND transporter permease subunit [Xanthomonas campestris pv. merremiae]|uniref:efflux RND transporter permease subunit n=1 Tax=Xanthomonas citri TaxID=346 RepID=UPI000B5CEEDE|nr:efflux RND transporter permease subunit [Xanthomonas citri]ASK96807.1 hydrophobe/amphiphile efflux-1 family RND transporter [Xanthomonas citri pv. vignicola]MBV6839599.1 efflux RND transporter permease subunit [Xanthomonas campestris pv. merremiae]MBZ3934000.1 multidrug transporter [Xanthomonas campestris pv. merremiae]MCC8565648.1 efflux RND transporter permease subunit [Xanthomonas citri pv. fuscans]